MRSGSAVGLVDYIGVCGREGCYAALSKYCVKEMLYLAVSITNGCKYGIACHTALAKKAGMTDAMFAELLAVVGMANQTNRFADAFRLPVDPEFDV
jgi:AhpD family alkylhydroperoxidase